MQIFIIFRLFFSNKNVIFLFYSSSLVHSGPDRGSPHSGTELFFATRTGTRLGIEAHLFRVETTKDLSLWTRHIVNGCHASAEMIKEVTTSKRSWKITYKSSDLVLYKMWKLDILVAWTEIGTDASCAGHWAEYSDASSHRFRHTAATQLHRGLTVSEARYCLWSFKPKIKSIPSA